MVRPARPRGCGASGQLSASPARHPGLRLAVVGRRSARVLGWAQPSLPPRPAWSPLGSVPSGSRCFSGHGDPDGWMGGRWREGRPVCAVVGAVASRRPGGGALGCAWEKTWRVARGGLRCPRRRGTALVCGGGIPCPFPRRVRLLWPKALPASSPSCLRCLALRGPGAAPTPPRCRCGLGRSPSPLRGRVGSLRAPLPACPWGPCGVGVCP